MVMMDHYSPIQPVGPLNSTLNNNINQAIPSQSEQDMDQQMLAMAAQQPAQQQQATRYMNQRDKALMYQLNQYYLAKATTRSKNILKTIQEVVKIVHDVLRELEIQEPRFISTFTEINGHYEG